MYSSSFGASRRFKRVDDARAEERGVVALEELVAVERHHGEAVAPTDAETAQAARRGARPGRGARPNVARYSPSKKPDAIGVALHRGKQQAVIDELFHEPSPCVTPVASRR